MPRSYTFKTITENNLAWHPELGGEYYDWLWLDGWSEDGYTYGLTMAVRLDMAAQVVGPENKDLPLIDCLVTSPEGVTHRVARAFPVEEFKTEEPWGVTIAGNSCIGTLAPDGKPAGYRIKVGLDGVGIDVSARAVAVGMQFVEAEHGYTYYHPVKNVGVGWWPLVVRAEMEGTVTFHGATVPVKGLAYCERQLGNMSFEATMAHWFWGHFYAGDYTAIWTDAASPERMQYRHFSPFILYKGGDPILCTHNLALSAEKFELDPENGMPCPVAQTLHATQGDTEITAVLHRGVIIERECLVDTAGTVFTGENPGGYFRQVCPIDLQVRRWDRVEQLQGTCQHEFGWMSQWFPASPRRQPPEGGV